MLSTLMGFLHTTLFKTKPKLNSLLLKHDSTNIFF